MAKHPLIVMEIYSIMEKRINFIDGKYVYDHDGLKYEFEKAKNINWRYADWPGVKSFFQVMALEAGEIFDSIFDELHPY